jgi:nucleoside-diphosphate-sugar epimerase
MLGSHPTATRKRALVTGCAGFVGSHLAESLLADHIEVLGVDCFNDNYGRAQKLANLRHLTDWNGFEFVPIDLARGDLHDLVDQCGVIFHLAAEPGVRRGWGARYEQYLRNNVLATQHLLEALRSLPGRRMVYASSSSVYGDAEILPTPESARLRPRSPYGQTKVAVEHLCDVYQRSFDVDTVGLRYFTVYGPRQRPDMAFHRLCRAAVEQRSFAVFGDGQQTRDFSYVADIVAGTRAASELAGTGQLFNLGGGSPASLRDAIELVEELAGRALDVKYGDPEAGDVRDTAADTTVAREALGFSPQIGLAPGLSAEFYWIVDELARNQLAPLPS